MSLISPPDGPVAPGDPAARLRALDWSGLEGLGPLVCAALEPVLAGRSAERALDRLLRDHRQWTQPQRAAVAEALFGVALWRRRLAVHAGLSWSDEGAAHGLPPHAPVLLCALLRDLAGLDEARALALSGCMQAPGGRAPASPDERCSAPRWLWERLAADLGAGAAARFLESICAPGPIFLRANRLLCDREALRAALGLDGIEAVPCRFAPDGLRVLTPRPNLLACAAFRAGQLEVQDEGSQLLGALLEARPGEAVLDLCAGAGGKSLQLAAAVGHGGRVLCADPDGARLGRLRERARRAQARCIELREQLPDDLEVDRVLVDAPCSELGALRRGPDARFRIDPGSLATLPELQLEILLRGARHVRPGGRLVYATCTVLRAENEEVALAFERASPGFARMRPCAELLDERFFACGDRFFRALPHLHGTDGFFAAAWQRT